ncbi:MAG TPA: GPR1/FUN34/YaaH family transporter [Solirubrobacteraceae bacterium]|nr:GPR1/FUN34/YaaH family transporter [Solirubrobacteraceae bacterium]
MATTTIHRAPNDTHTSVDQILELEGKGAGIYFAPSSQGISLQLGLLGILLLMLWGFQAQIVSPDGLPFMEPLALSLGAVGIFAGGMWNLRNGVTVAGVIGGIYGVFWLSFGFILLLQFGPLTTSKAVGPAEFGHILGMYLWIMALVTALLAIPTLWVNKTVFAQQALLIFVFIFLGIGYSSAPGGSGMLEAGGWVSLIDGLLALWVSIALLTNETAGKNVIPLP